MTPDLERRLGDLVSLLTAAYARVPPQRNTVQTVDVQTSLTAAVIVARSLGADSFITLSFSTASHVLLTNSEDTTDISAVVPRIAAGVHDFFVPAGRHVVVQAADVAGTVGAWRSSPDAWR